MTQTIAEIKAVLRDLGEDPDLTDCLPICGYIQDYTREEVALMLPLAIEQYRVNQ